MTEWSGVLNFPQLWTCLFPLNNTSQQETPQWSNLAVPLKAQLLTTDSKNTWAAHRNSKYQRQITVARFFSTEEKRNRTEFCCIKLERSNAKRGLQRHNAFFLVQFCWTHNCPSFETVNWNLSRLWSKVTFVVGNLSCIFPNLRVARGEDSSLRPHMPEKKCVDSWNRKMRRESNSSSLT